MEEICVKVDIHPDFKEEFRLAIARLVKEFVKNLELSVFNEISEISEYDSREVKESIVKEVIESSGRTSEKIRSGKLKPISIEEFNNWCNSL